MNLGPRLKHLDNRYTLHRLHKSLHPMKESKPRESFIHYITRPTGMGRTAWWAAIVINAALLFMLSFYLWADDSTKYVLPFIGLIVGAIYWFGTVKNWKVDRDGSPRHPNNHYPDVCENCDPLCMKDGNPIPWISWWYAATRGITREQAKAQLDDMPSDKYQGVIDGYTTYLSHPKFK